MTSDERRGRRRERMRGKILAAAMQLFVRQGFENVSMRGIARKIDYSPAAIYRYFKDKNEILAVLRVEGFALFVERQKKTLHFPDPQTRLFESGLAYLAFAQEHPEYFHLMFNLDVHDKGCEEYWTGKPQESYDILQKTVMDCIEDGHFSGVSPAAAIFGLWAAAHGLANMLISGRLAALAGEEGLRELLENVMAFHIRPCLTGAQTPTSGAETS